ncbi:MAG: AI-2E family transporter [Longimicrobiales bacterium]
MTESDAKGRFKAPEWAWIYAAIVVMVAGVWLRTLAVVPTSPGPFLGPVIAFALLIALLRPFTGTKRHRTLIIAVTGIMVLWLLRSLGSILAPFIVAFVIAYILHPVVDKLEKRGMPRLAAVAVLMVPILAAIVLVLVFGLPALAAQISSLIDRLPEAVQRMNNALDGFRTKLAHSNLPFINGDRMSAQLSIDEEKVAAFISKQQAEIASRAWSAVLGVGKGLSFLLTMVGYLVLTPVLIIYLLNDYRTGTVKVRDMIPLPHRARWMAFFTEFDDLLSRFLRGQVIEAVLVGILTWLGLLVLGVPYSGLVGTVAGVFNLIPYLGLVVSILPVIIIAVLSGDFVSVVAKSGIVFFIVQLIDSTITGPRIVGGSIGLHPVIVILALAVGSSYFGFVGLLLAMPAAILLKLLVRDAVARYKASRLYLGEPTAEGE